MNTLRVEIWDWDKVGDHEFLGQTELQGMATEMLPYYETNYELQPRNIQSAGWKAGLKQLFQRDWHVGGKLCLSMVNEADAETKKWGISEEGRLVPLPKDFHAPKAAEEEEYEVAVVTGDIRGAGTDANIFIRVVGQKVRRRRPRGPLESGSQPAGLVVVAACCAGDMLRYRTVYLRADWEKNRGSLAQQRLSAEGREQELVRAGEAR